MHACGNAPVFPERCTTISVAIRTPVFAYAAPGSRLA